MNGDEAEKSKAKKAILLLYILMIVGIVGPLLFLLLKK